MIGCTRELICLCSRHISDYVLLGIMLGQSRQYSRNALRATVLSPL